MQILMRFLNMVQYHRLPQWGRRLASDLHRRAFTIQVIRRLAGKCVGGAGRMLATYIGFLEVRHAISAVFVIPFRELMDRTPRGLGDDEIEKAMNIY